MAGPWPTIAIIGTGHAGLCVAMQLVRLGCRSFTILEKSDRVGGTWRDNGYPGAACDTPAVHYCFSFAPKVDWNRKWAEQPEILGYMESCAREYGLYDHIRFRTEVTSARFDEAATRWRIATAAGEELSAEVLISAVGQLGRPRTPAIPGLTDHPAWFHSGRWNHEIDLAGKRVAVIGSAASAIQIVPAIVDRVSELRVFQRSASYLFPKNDRVYPTWEKRLYRRVPALAKLYRWWIWLTHELRFPILRGNAFMTRRAYELARGHLAEQVNDPELRRKLTPDYPIGAKRLLISDDFYPALTRDHVELITEPIERVDSDAVVTGDGARHPADVVICATGFKSTEFLAPMEITGRAGRPLSDAWARGAEAYYGITVAGFPNLFVMYGPNTNLGHNSIIFMIECQTRYILDCLEQMRARDLAAIELRPEVQQRYNDRIAGELDRTVWRRVDRSWYMNDAGRITNNWPGSTARYWWETRRADLSDYRTYPAR